MSPSMKAMMVVVGLFVFCGISILGPFLGQAGEVTATTVFGVHPDQALKNKSRKTDPDYAVSPTNTKPPLRSASVCCEETCGIDWNFKQTRCDIATQKQSTCFQTCLAKSAP